MKRRTLLLAMLVALAFSLDSQNGNRKSGENMMTSMLSLTGLTLAAQDNVKLKLKKKQTFDGYYQGYFSPDSKKLALLYRDHVDMVEISSGHRLFRLQLPQGQFFSVAFSPDGRTLATALIEIRQSRQIEKLVLWDAAKGSEIRTFASDSPGLNAVYNLSFTEDGQWLASHVGGIARIFEVETGQEVRRFSPPADPPGLEPAASLISPDGKWLAVDFRRFIPPLLYDSMKVWNLETGHEIVLQTDANIYQDWRFSPDSTMLAVTAQIDGPVPTVRPVVAQIWEVGSWTLKRVIEVPDPWQAALSLAFSPDSESLLIGGNKMFGLFSIGKGDLLAEKRHTIGESKSVIYYDLNWVEFSPDGKTLLTAGNDNYVRLWKIKNKKLSSG